MTRYSIRDILGHFVTPKSRRGDMCPHACCRGRRVHPDKFPVILKPRMLRQASDDELADHYGRYAGNAKAQRQVVRELERRDNAVIRARGAKDRAAARKYERQSAIEDEILAAENATRGNLFNKAGQRKGITERALFTGSEANAHRYASEELLRYWETHARPSAGRMSGNATVRRRAHAASNAGRTGRTGGRAGGSVYRDIY
jgi:hypothetical protein